MRVQLGTTRDHVPVQMLSTESGTVLVLRKGLPVTEELVRRLDELLQGYGPTELRTQRMFPYGDAAKALGVSPAWLKARVRTGEIPHHKVGTYVRFTAEDVDRIRYSMQRGGGDSA